MPESDGNEGEGDDRVPEVGPLKKKWSREEFEAILDYLHGDTPVREVEACLLVFKFRKRFSDVGLNNILL